MKDLRQRGSELKSSLLHFRRSPGPDKIKVARTRQAAQAPPFRPIRVDSLAAFQQYQSNCGGGKDDTLIMDSLGDSAEEFAVPGYCWVDHANVQFKVDFQNAYEIDGKRVPNWRERVVCPLCGLNNRQRAAIHLFEQHLLPHQASAIYITEQLTPLYQWLRANYHDVLGSEYLGSEFLPGEVNDADIRHEDLTRLSMPVDTVNFILSFDVFEHVPDYMEAFAQCSRVLKPGGTMLFTVPFGAGLDENLIRTTLDERGQPTHHLPPEYHGDPVLPERGVLCYQYFGWEMLSQLRSIGFRDAYALFYRSRELGYLGDYQMAFIARKPNLRSTIVRKQISCSSK